MASQFLNLPGAVTSLNGLSGGVSIVAGSNVMVTPSGSTITISSTGGSGSTGVSSLNTLSGSLTIAAGSALVVTPTGSTLTISPAAVTGSGSTVVLSASPVFSGTPTYVYGNYHCEPLEATPAANGSIDLSTGGGQAITLGSSITLAFYNPQAGGPYVLRVTQGSGSYTLTWPGSPTVVFPSGSSPVMSTGAGKQDLYNIYYTGGSQYLVTYAQNF